MYVTMRCGGRPLVVTSLAAFESLLDFVESQPDAYERFPQLMSCEGQGVMYSLREAGQLAGELISLDGDLANGSKCRAGDFRPVVDRMIRIVMSCIRAREPVVIEAARTVPAMKAA